MNNLLFDQSLPSVDDILKRHPEYFEQALASKEAAAFIDSTPAALAQMRGRGTGPTYRRLSTTTPLDSRSRPRGPIRYIRRDLIEWLRKQSVPESALTGWPGPVGAAPIETRAQGIFDFAEVGRRAFIQPVRTGGKNTHIADLVAWYPDDPSRWWTRLYTGTPLGIDQLDRAELLGKPLAIRRTPLSWLQAGGNGVVITSWAMSASTLRSCPTLDCENESNAAEVSECLRTPVRMPKIRYPRRAA